jgi:hypothetical protein
MKELMLGPSIKSFQRGQEKDQIEGRKRRIISMEKKPTIYYRALDPLPQRVDVDGGVGWAVGVYAAACSLHAWKL